jgi:hypothetical protein
LAGCAQQPQADAQLPQAAVASEPAQPVSPAATPLTATQSVAFEYPADRGGRSVVQAVAPDTPTLPPVNRFGTAPTPRAVPARVLNPDVFAKAKYALPSVLLHAKTASVRLAQPPERVPPDLGAGAAAVPMRPTLPVNAGITERSRDVNLPPAMPTLGRPLVERVSLDDPTSELGNAVVVNPAVKVPLAPAAFVKVTLPDPFEFGEQVKPKVPPAAEPGLTPVPVDPRRVK